MSANKLTIARVKKLARSVEAPVVVATSRALTLEDAGKVLLVTAAVTVTIPQDVFPVGFRCEFIAPVGVNLSVDPLGTVTLNGAGTTLTRARATNFAPVALFVSAANVVMLGGA